MSEKAVETSERAAPTVVDRIIDAGRHAAHLSHEARAVKTMAEDAIEDGVHAAKRAAKSVRHGLERLEDARDEGIHLLKRRPLKTLAVTAGVGLTVGLVAGWVAGRFSAGRRNS